MIRRARPLRGLRAPAVATLAFAALAGCASIDNAPLNRPLALPVVADAHEIASGDTLRSTMIGLAFSGGGTRAAAFSFGVLKGLEAVELTAGGTLLDQVRFVSGVSGGAVTAAYFGLKGRSALADFESRFLLRDAEEGLRTSVLSPTNVLRAIDGGVNDRSGLTAWLVRNVFGNATFGDMRKPGRPTVWINASDIAAKTPFVFEPLTFAAICSDLASYPLADAVAASAAVPIAFAPIVVRSFAEKCGFKLPAHLEAAARGRDASPTVQAYARALATYRDPSALKFIKLLDGGLTDNYGLGALNVALSASPDPWAPLSKDEALALKRFVFVIVDSGRSNDADWTKTLEGPTGTDLLAAVTDTAVDSAVRASFEVFRLQARAWEERLKAWRCGLSEAELTTLRGSAQGWDCRDVAIVVKRLSFEDLGPAAAARLGRIPTRFKLAPTDVQLAVQAGEQAARAALGAM